LLTAGVLLAVMIVPFIIAVGREVLLAVPQAQRDGALALGATRWETVRQVVLPYARSGILGATFLALARALGETMAVTMVIGNRPEIAASLFAPAHTMAAVLANEFAEAASDVHLAALVEVALVLFGITLVVNAVARLLILGPPGTERARACPRWIRAPRAGAAPSAPCSRPLWPPRRPSSASSSSCSGTSSGRGRRRCRSTSSRTSRRRSARPGAGWPTRSSAAPSCCSLPPSWGCRSAFSAASISRSTTAAASRSRSAMPPTC